MLYLNDKFDQFYFMELEKKKRKAKKKYFERNENRSHCRRKDNSLLITEHQSRGDKRVRRIEIKPIICLSIKHMPVKCAHRT